MHMLCNVNIEHQIKKTMSVIQPAYWQLLSGMVAVILPWLSWYPWFSRPQLGPSSTVSRLLSDIFRCSSGRRYADCNKPESEKRHLKGVKRNEMRTSIHVTRYSLYSSFSWKYCEIVIAVTKLQSGENLFTKMFLIYV